MSWLTLNLNSLIQPSFYVAFLVVIRKLGCFTDKIVIRNWEPSYNESNFNFKSDISHKSEKAYKGAWVAQRISCDECFVVLKRQITKAVIELVDVLIKSAINSITRYA